MSKQEGEAPESVSRVSANIREGASKLVSGVPTKKIYVDPKNGDDNADGKTPKTALYSINGALKVINQSGPGNYEIMVLKTSNLSPPPEPDRQPEKG